jgi:hypothetical protein
MSFMMDKGRGLFQLVWQWKLRWMREWLKSCLPELLTDDLKPFIYLRGLAKVPDVPILKQTECSQI